MANNRSRGKDSYSYHGEVTPRIVAAIMTYPSDIPLYRAHIARHAEISIPTVTKVTDWLVDQSLLDEDGYVLIGPYKRPTPRLIVTEDLAPTVAANPEWQLATDVKRLMIATGMQEVNLLQLALNAFEAIQTPEA